VKAAALLLVAAIAAAGCGGGDDSNDFRKGYNAVVRQYSSLPGEVGTAVRGASAKTDKQLEAQFTDLADRLSDELAKLRKLHPPGRAKDEYKAFIDDLAKVEDDLDAIARSAKAHSAKQASKASKALVKDSTSVDKDEDALKKAVD
jgi:hypothetical protein